MCQCVWLRTQLALGYLPSSLSDVKFYWLRRACYPRVHLFTLSLLKCARRCSLFWLFWFISIIIMSHLANQHLSWLWDDLSKLCACVCVCLHVCFAICMRAMFLCVVSLTNCSVFNAIRENDSIRNIQLRCVQSTCYLPLYKHLLCSFLLSHYRM